MADTFDVNVVCLGNVGALSNGSRAMAQLPATGGAITVLNANVVSGGAGTTSLYLVDMGTAGTSVSGTIASFPGTVAAGPNTGTLVTAVVEGGHWIGIYEANAGAANAVTVPSFSYLMGK